MNFFFSKLEERKRQRANINSIGLNESWLRNKDDKTEMETLLYHQLLQERFSEQIFEREQVRTLSFQTYYLLLANEDVGFTGLKFACLFLNFHCNINGVVVYFRYNAHTLCVCYLHSLCSFYSQSFHRGVEFNEPITYLVHLVVMVIL